MAVEIKHKFQSVVPDGPNTGFVRPSNWNDTHNISMDGERLLGKPTAGTGDAVEIGLGAGLQFSSTNITVTFGSTAGTAAEGNHTHPEATTSVSGFLSALDKAKLDGLAAVASSGSYNDLTNRPTLGSAAALNVGASAGTVAAGDDSRITGAIQTGSHAATSVIGRSANSTGNAADIAASTNDRILARVSNALSWVQLTIGMIPDSLITFAKLASGAVASFGEFNTATASKLLSTASVWASPVALSDATTISIDLNNGYDFTVTLGGNRTLGAPSNVRHGKKGIVWASASGSTRTLTLNGAWVLEADAEEGPYEIATTERLGICYVCDGSTPRITGILRYS